MSANGISEEMRQLAREVLKEDADLTVVAALNDCVRSELDFPNLRFSLHWIQRLEGTISHWREMLMKGRWSVAREEDGVMHPSGFLVPEPFYMQIVRDYQSLREECKSVFERELA